MASHGRVKFFGQSNCCCAHSIGNASVVISSVVISRKMRVIFALESMQFDINICPIHVFSLIKPVSLPGQLSCPTCVGKALRVRVHINPSCMCLPWLYNENSVYTAKPERDKCVNFVFGSPARPTHTFVSNVTASSEREGMAQR